MERNSGQILLRLALGAIVFGGVANAVATDIDINDSRNQTVTYWHFQNVHVTEEGSVDIEAHDPNDNFYAIAAYASQNNKGIGPGRIIENNGTLSVHGDVNISTAIANFYHSNGQAYWLENNGTIRNNGEISVDTTGLHAGGIHSGVNNGMIHNVGTIDITSESEGSTQTFGIGVVGANNGDIVNDGEITTATRAGTHLTRSVMATAIYQWENSGTVVNNGEITARASAQGDHNSVFATGILNWGNHSNARIVNNGRITAEATAVGEFSHALADGMYMAGWNEGSIVNTKDGTILVRAQSGDETTVTGIAVGRNENIVINEGTVDVFAKGESDTWAYAMIVGMNHATVINSGELSAAASGSQARAYSLHIEYGGVNSVFRNTITGVMHGSVIAKKTDVFNEGEIHLGFEDSIAGNFYQTAGGTLGIKAEMSNGAIVRNSLLHVDGTATFEDGSQIYVDVQGDRSVLRQETNITIVEAGTMQVDADTLNVTDNSFLLDFQAWADATTLNLLATQAIPLGNAVASSSYSGYADAARALDDILESGSTAMDDIFDELDTLSSAEQVGRAVASMTPQGIAYVPDAAHILIGMAQSTIGQRLGNRGGLNSGGDILPAARTRSGYELWIKPYGGKARQENKDGLRGYDLSGGGIGFGADREFGEGNRFGLAFFYGRGNLDVNDIDQNVDLDLYTLMAYGSSTFLLNRPTEFFWEAGYSWQNIDFTRTEWPSGDRYTADIDGYAFTLNARLRQHYELSEDWGVRLSLFADYGHYHTDGYTEKGSGTAPLSVDSNSVDRFVVGTGAVFEYALSDHQRFLFGGDLGYNLGDKESVVTAQWRNVPVTFATHGIDNGGWVYNLGVDYEYENDSFALSVGYRYSGEGSKLDSHSVGAKLTYKF